jgi:glucose/arabinose dehydrogenase
MRARSIVFALTCAAVIFCGGQARATPVDTANFAETLFVQNNTSLTLPTGLAWAPDGSGRLFVLRKGGEVRVVQYTPATSTGTLVANPWATISPVFTNSECGLIGSCFDPDFINNRYVYFFATVSGDATAFTGEQQIIRYTDDPGTNTGSGKTILVSGLPTRAVNHDGGGIGIGLDGRLYWSIGDNGNNTGVDSDLVSFCAKVSRANRFTGAALNDNPFFDGAGGNNDYIWARGCRNPFTMCFQPGTGKLWLNVVGSSITGDTIPNSGFGYEQVFVITRGANLGWNDYENNQPAGFLTPLIAYRVNSTTSVSLTASGASRIGNVATFMTQSFHPFRQGAKVTIAGVANNSFNGAFYVASRVSDTIFTVAQSGSDEASGGGTATTLGIGGSITGGCFYDSTAFPAAYRGNYFFGDVNTGNVARTTLDAGDVPTSVDLFATAVNQAVDSAIGPDGALYIAQNGSASVRRIATTSAAQNLIVQPTALGVPEGGGAVFTVRLAQAPAANVSVAISKTGGDPDLTLASASTLTFTPANWNQLQAVTLAAAEDADLDAGTATFDVSAAGIATYSVKATEIENDEARLVLSQNNVSLVEGGTGTFQVSLATAPASNVTVTVARSSGDSDLNVTGGAVLSFTTLNFATPQTVTISAAEDADNVSDAAIFFVSLAGEPDRLVNVTASDNDNAAPVITSTAKTTAIVNSPYTYDVNATGNPVPSYSFSVRPTGMNLNNVTGVITWTPTATGTFPVTVQVSNGVAPNATQNFNLVVSNDGPPTAVITQPLAGAILSGANSEFFGDGQDDVGTVKAEFFVDGVLAYTDTSAGQHYHINGTHALFDTTQYTNGAHTLRMRVTDTIGQTGFTDRQVTFGNQIAGWKKEKFTPAEQANSAISGDNADPEGDGLTNLAEYALNLPPKASSTTGLPTCAIVNVGGTNYLTLTFTRVKWATDLTYIVEADNDLVPAWQQIDPLVPQNQVSVLDNTPAYGLQTITVKDVVPAGTTPRYMRLRIVK